jgi:Polyketide cyclase / dehydrase and lipid transport
VRAACSQSIVIGRDADRVWQAIRRFDAYEWAGDVRDVRIENDVPADRVGALRSFAIGDARVRERLLAHSDADRSYTYTCCGHMPIDNYRATLRVMPGPPCVPIAIVEYSARFDCPDGDERRWRAMLQASFARSLDALRASLAANVSMDNPAQPDLKEMWKRRVAEDSRYWQPRTSAATAPATADPVPSDDLNWLWKTIENAARG